ncbi:MAG: hypothetical protein K2H43_01910, partial [Clostridia bacterium]|nr:hypothetical protein [Clostridia bacterium]
TEQVTLTYAGAQLPNYREQCTEFLRYQQEEYRNGSFKDMLTPEGFATTAPEDGRKVWDHYYEIAKAMARDSLQGSSKRTYTVKKWIEECGFTDYGSSDPVRYDTQYDDVLLSAFTGENNTNISFAMKVLRMVCFTYAERDMNIRMQYGLNSVRDSSMYTEDSTWIAALNASSQATMLAYINQRTLTANELNGMTTGSMIARTMGERASLGNTGFWTPAVYCINTAGTAQRALNNNK